MDRRRFWLVQRIKHAPWRKSETASPLAKLTFGGGFIGEYELDYMGSSEFEWGAIPEASGRLNGKVLEIAEHECGGYLFDFLYVKSEGEPFDDFDQWARGEGGFGSPFRSLEKPYELGRVFEGERAPLDCRTAIWWSLADNVMWAFAETGHLHKMLEGVDHERAS